MDGSTPLYIAPQKGNVDIKFNPNEYIYADEDGVIVTENKAN